MPLDLKKLEKLVDMADGVMRARCPACAEMGQDTKGMHLRIYPDGRFGCCVFSGDREHRKRIMALCGERGRQGIKVRVAAAKPGGPAQTGVLGRLGRLFANPAQETPVTDATDGVSEVQTRFSENQPSRTPRTGVSKSKHESAWDGCLSLAENGNPRTPRTPFENPRVYIEKNPSIEGVHVSTLKEFRKGVRSVREGEGGEGVAQPPKTAEQQGRMPYFTPGGTLVIPFDSPERFHWWKPDGHRQSVKDTIAELRRKPLPPEILPGT